MTAAEEGSSLVRTPGGDQQGRRVLGVDGKSYPGQWLNLSDRTRLIGTVHQLSHDDGLSVRQIVARLAGDYGIRRSVGWTSEALRKWTCQRCPAGVQETQMSTPEHLGRQA
ncbi:hypothetical protein ACSR0Z_27980 [Streptomyces viridosporus]